MQKFKFITFYGFVIFAMFFGSGNLVLPLQIGYNSGEYWYIAAMGMLITGIILPFLGLIVIKLYNGDYNLFFANTGKVGKFLPAMILSLLGPFGITPRCITVAHGGVQYLMPELSLLTFSLLFSIIAYFLCLKDRFMIKALGKFLSPLKMLTLFLLISMGVYYAGAEYKHTEPYSVFVNGLQTSYQTMDLFAAFFFSALIFQQIQENIPNRDEHKVLKYSIASGAVGFAILAVIYVGLIYLSARYANLLDGVKPQLMLPTISMHIMGEFAGFFIAFTMFFSCLATAVTLNNIYANYICKLFKIDKKNFSKILLLVMLTAFLVSLLDFSGISAFLVPILEITYPGLIIMTLISIIVRKRHIIKVYIFWIVTVLTICNTFAHFWL